MSVNFDAVLVLAVLWCAWRAWQYIARQRAKRARLQNRIRDLTH